MKKMLYIGNMRLDAQSAVSVMEEHGALLAQHFSIKFASGRRNKIFRLTEMVVQVIRHPKHSGFVLIATYSTLNFYYALVVSQLCRLLGKPYIAYLHGGALPARLKQHPSLSRAVFAHAYANIAPSAYLQRAFESNGYTVQTIPNFIQLDQYPFKHRKHLRPRLLWVRSFEQTYHPEMTVQVFAAILEKYPNAHLCMVGPDKDGSLERCKMLAAQLNLSPNIRFAGSLPKKSWVELSVDYDIFISSTRFDNMPVSVIEAMALGLPVVSTSVGGMPFLIEDGKEGLLSPDNDPKAMVQNIQSLLEQPGMAGKISGQARAKATTFDWKVVEKQWMALLGADNPSSCQ